MSTDVSFILDNKSSAFRYGGNTRWTDVAGAFMDAAVAFAAPSPGTFGTITATFNGTGIAFIGNTPPLTSSQSMLVSIDNNAPYNTSFFASGSDSDNVQSYSQFYQSPKLDDGHHTIVLDKLDGIAFDYAVVTAGNSSVLTEARIIVDDNDPSMTFTGSGWKKTTDRFDGIQGQPGGYPFNNGTHQTSNVFDSVSIPFAGSTILLFGSFNYTEPGSLTANFALDDLPPVTQTFTINENTTELKSGGGLKQNIRFFSKTDLSATPHTLVVTITNSQNMNFSVDYAYYQSYFDNLASKPDLSPSHSAPGGSPTNTPKSGHKSNVGGIAGGVVGGLAALLLLLLGVYFLRRKKVTRKPRELPILDEPREMGSAPIVYDNPSMAPILKPDVTRMHSYQHSYQQSYHDDSYHDAIPRPFSPYTESVAGMSDFTSPTSTSAPLSLVGGPNKKYMEAMEARQGSSSAAITSPPAYSELHAVNRD